MGLPSLVRSRWQELHHVLMLLELIQKTSLCAAAFSMRGSFRTGWLEQRIWQQVHVRLTGPF